ncbi:MAG: DUF2203 family protein [Dehalococcoidia bacterium]|nr:DUF2203 family protein [Dehalococcoidia bacterium]
MPFFTLREAAALLPWLSAQLDEIAVTTGELARVNAQADAARVASRSNGGSSNGEDAQRRRAEADRLTVRVGELLQEVADKGILLRDPQRGLVDFPALRDGREVYLCWLKGEEVIRFWHEVDAGFGGRQPL